MLKLYRHPGRSGLAEWLVKEGRPLRRDDPLAQTSTAYADICRSFDVLQASVCIPLAALGELLGILALGNGMKGEPPTDEQVEVLFGVCSHVAVAMQNIQMHQEMERQKLLNESVLQHMTNGVAAIDADGQITLFNRRAAEITGLASEMIVGRDLRLLPAPLADYLFEAMRTGKVSRNTNVSLPGSGLPIEASMYPLVLPGVANPVGSVPVVEDISERKTLDATRRHADRQDILARLVGQLAHELRNPLTAVKTFADLFPHERSDPEFLTFVERTVIPEIFRLDQIVGKLTDFVNHSSLEMTSCSLAAVLDDLVQRAAAEAGALMVKIRLLVEDDTQPVRADSNLLSKALWYLLLHLMQNAPRDEGAEITIRAFRETDPPNRVIVDLASNKPWVRDEELESVFDPLLVSQDQLNLALPVARKIIQEHRGDVEAISGKAGLVTLRVSMQAGDEAWQAPASLGFEEIGPPRKVVSLGYDFDE